MKRLLVTNCILCFLTLFAKAQVENHGKLNPLILVDTAITCNESMILHPSRFISISTINPKKAIELYGSQGRFGVIVIETTQDIPFVRLNSILDKFRIEEKYRNLRVCINKVPVSEPDKILADLNEIRDVEVISTPANATASQAVASSFINIITQQGL